MMQKLECLPLEEVVRACEHEAQEYRSQHSTTDLFRLELFRRAICQQDQAAWQEIYALYASLVCSWIWRYARGTTWLDQEEAASLANVAFAKLARNLTASKFENFASIGAILGYFKLVVHSVVADERAFRDSLRDQQAETAGLLSLSYRGAEDLASIVASNEDARLLLQDIFACLKGERERAYVIYAYLYGMKPQQIVQHSSRLFPSVRDVYRVRANIQDRLRRSYKYHQHFRREEPRAGDDPESESFPAIHVSPFEELIYE